MKVKLRGYEIIIDKEELWRLKKYNWHHSVMGKYIYFSRSEYINKEKSKYFLLHREIMDCPKGFEVDHVNGNTLDNRKCNLRICTHAENQRNRGLNKNNTSGIKGVRFNKREKIWIAYTSLNYKQIHLGRYKTKEGAQKVYNDSIDKYHGDFSRRE